MKKIKLVVLFSIILSCTALAQKNNGFIILNSGDTMKVKIKLSDGLMSKGTNLYDLQWKVHYFDSLNEYQSMKISELKELHFTLGDNYFKMVAFKNTMKVKDKNYVVPKYVMLYEIQKGRLSNYSYNYGDLSTYGNSTPIVVTNHTPSGFRQTTVNSNNRLLTAALLEGRLFLNVLILEGKEPEVITNRNFKKPLLKYLFECKDVTTKIENDSYSKKDLMKIVEQYNADCN